MRIRKTAKEVQTQIEERSQVLEEAEDYLNPKPGGRYRGAVGTEVSSSRQAKGDCMREVKRKMTYMVSILRMSGVRLDQTAFMENRHDGWTLSLSSVERVVVCDESSGWLCCEGVVDIKACMLFFSDAGGGSRPVQVRIWQLVFYCSLLWRMG